MRLLLAALALAGAAGFVSAKETAIDLEARDDGTYRFVHASGSNPTLTAQPGDRVTIRLANTGSTGHNWQLAGVADAAIPFPLAPGASGNVTFPAAEGDWRYVCLAHEAHGMAGTLRVEKAGIPGLPILAILALMLLALARRR